MASASGLGEGRPTRSGARHGSPNNKENLVKKCRFSRKKQIKYASIKFFQKIFDLLLRNTCFLPYIMVVYLYGYTVRYTRSIFKSLERT